MNFTLIEYLAASDMTLAQIEKEMLKAKLIAMRGRKARVARSLGIARPTLYRKIKKHGLIDLLREIDALREDKEP